MSDNLEGGIVDMCKAFDEWMDDCREEGIKKGESRFALLIQKLAEENRMSEILRAAENLSLIHIFFILYGRHRYPFAICFTVAPVFPVHSLVFRSQKERTDIPAPMTADPPVSLHFTESIIPACILIHFRTFQRIDRTDLNTEVTVIADIRLQLISQMCIRDRL